MSGKALVQFDAYDNVGWYDIDPAFLKVVDQPLAKPVKSEPATKPKATSTKPAPAAAPASAPKLSTADILAAARTKSAGGTAATPSAAGARQPTKADEPAAPQAPGEVAKPAAKMSVEEILAAARGKKEAAQASATSAEKKPAEAKISAVPSATQQPAAQDDHVEPAGTAEPVVTKAEKAASVSTTTLPKDLPGILAFCRLRDGNS
jgi:hypothetical protein